MSWKTVSLGKICSIKTGKKDVNEGNLNGDYPFFTCASKHTYSDFYSFDCEAILIAGNGAVGQTNYYNGKFEAYQRTYVLCDFVDVLPKYLLYVLNGNLVQDLSTQVLGNTIPYIKKGMLTDFQVPLPAIPIQQKIVEKLDFLIAEIDKAKQACETNAKNAEALFQSYLSEVFECSSEDWDDRKLADISLYMGRGKSKHRPRNDASLYGGDYPFIQTGDVRNADKFIKSYSQTYNDKGLSQSKLWKANTVCITIAANIAEIGILSFDACFPDSVIGIVVDDEKVSQDFLYLMLLFAQKRIKDKSKGSAQENINLGTFEDMFFKVAPLIKQQIIVEKFNDLKHVADLIKNSNFSRINELVSLEKSILKKAFNGELVKD